MKTLPFYPYLNDHGALLDIRGEFCKDYFKNLRSLYDLVNLNFRQTTIYFKEDNETIDHVETLITLPPAISAFQGSAHGGSIGLILQSCCAVAYGFPRLLFFKERLIACDFETKFKKPAPVGIPLKVITYCTKEEDRRKFTMEATLVDPEESNIFAIGTGFFLKSSI